MIDSLQRKLEVPGVSYVPCYFFTYHSYGSWMPDRPQGWVKRGAGVQPPDPGLAKAYRDAMNDEPVYFDPPTQHILIERLMAIAETERFRVHGAGAEPTHLHGLVSWRDGRRPVPLRGRIQCLLALHLSRLAGTTGRRWFVRQASRKRVRDRAHFEYLMQTYLPKHSGWRWYEDDRGWVAPQAR